MTNNRAAENKDFTELLMKCLCRGRKAFEAEWQDDAERARPFEGILCRQAASRDHAGARTSRQVATGIDGA